MAPATRLRAQPERRVDYRHIVSAGQAGSSHNPVESPPPQLPGAPRAKTKDKPAPKPTRDRQERFTGSHTSKPSSDRKKVRKTTALPKPKTRPSTTECSICATTKNTRRGFSAPIDGSTCAHFEAVCDLCIQKQIKTKMAARQLAEADLPCMFPGCDAVLDHAALKKVLSKALFQTWDEALTKHILAADPAYIACLSPQCGLYFSAEGCGSKSQQSDSKTETRSKGKQKQSEVSKAICPYCDAALCLSCNRPWHPSTCNRAKKLEDAQSLQAIEKLGAKPCPKCGLNIEKNGGCDHMNCHSCRHNFCFECLGAYTTNVPTHAPTCSHVARPIAHDVANFVPDDLDVAQVNALIERARRDRDAGRPVIPNLQAVGGARPIGWALAGTQMERLIVDQERAQRLRGLMMRNQAERRDGGVDDLGVPGVTLPGAATRSTVPVPPFAAPPVAEPAPPGGALIAAPPPAGVVAELAAAVRALRRTQALNGAGDED